MIQMPSRYQTTDQITTYLHQMVQQLNYELNKEDNDYVTRTEISKAIETQSATINKLIVKGRISANELKTTEACIGEKTALLQLKTQTYSSFWYNNGTNTYLLVSDSSKDTWNTLRPITVANATGNVNICGVLAINASDNNVRSTGYIYTSKYLSAAENIYCGSDTRDANTMCAVRNKYRYGGIYASNTGNLGLIDATTGKYVIYQDSDGVTRIPASLVCSSSVGASSIELTAATPFIDFHYGSSTADYTSRIREVAAGIIQIQVDQLRVSPMTSGGVPIIRSSSGTLQVGASDDSYVTYLSGSEVRVCNTARSAYKVIKASAFTVSSTRKLKDNIIPMTEECARKIKDLEVVTFDYKNGDKNQMGLIAEDAVNVYPSCVFGDVNATELEKIMGVGIDYSKYIPPLIKNQQLTMDDIEMLRKTQLEILEELAKIKNGG